MLFVLAILFYLIGKGEKAQRLHKNKYFFFLSILFTLLSIDEMSSIHELLINPLRNQFTLGGVFHFSWVIIYIPLVLLLALFLFRFYFSLEGYMKTGLFIAGVLYIGGAIGVEMVGGVVASNIGEDNLLYGLTTTLEESFELFGLLVLINTLLKRVVKGETSHIHIKITEGKKVPHN